MTSAVRTDAGQSVLSDRVVEATTSASTAPLSATTMTTTTTTVASDGCSGFHSDVRLPTAVWRSLNPLLPAHGPANTAPAAPAPRNAHVAVAFEGELYIYGGWYHEPAADDGDECEDEGIDVILGDLWRLRLPAGGPTGASSRPASAGAAAAAGANNTQLRWRELDSGVAANEDNDDVDEDERQSDGDDAEGDEGAVRSRRRAVRSQRPRGRWGHTAAVVGRAMYVVGGSPDQAAPEEVLEVWRYDFDTGDTSGAGWSPLETVAFDFSVYEDTVGSHSLQGGNRGSQGSARVGYGGDGGGVGGTLGSNGSAHNATISAGGASHPRSTTSKPAALRPSSVPTRYCHSCVAFGHSMFVFGGLVNAETACNDVLRIDPVDEQSKSGSGLIARRAELSSVEVHGSVPSPRFNHTASVLDGCMYVYGGTGPGSDENMHLLHVLEFATGLWRDVALDDIVVPVGMPAAASESAGSSSSLCSPPPHSRYMHAAVASPSRGLLFFFGGRRWDNEPVLSMLCVDVRTGRCVAIASHRGPYPQSVSSLSCCGVGEGAALSGENGMDGCSSGDKRNGQHSSVFPRNGSVNGDHSNVVNSKNAPAPFAILFGGEVEDDLYGSVSLGDLSDLSFSSADLDTLAALLARGRDGLRSSADSANALPSANAINASAVVVSGSGSDGSDGSAEGTGKGEGASTPSLPNSSVDTNGAAEDARARGGARGGAAAGVARATASPPTLVGAGGVAARAGAVAAPRTPSRGTATTAGAAGAAAADSLTSSSHSVGGGTADRDSSGAGAGHLGRVGRVGSGVAGDFSHGGGGGNIEGMGVFAAVGALGNGSGSGGSAGLGGSPFGAASSTAVHSALLTMVQQVHRDSCARFGDLHSAVADVSVRVDRLRDNVAASVLSVPAEQRVYNEMMLAELRLLREQNAQLTMQVASMAMAMQQQQLQNRQQQYQQNQPQSPQYPPQQ